MFELKLKMAIKKGIDFGVEVIITSAYNDLISDFNGMDLDDRIRQKIVDHIEEKKGKNLAPEKGNKKKKDPNAPKRKIDPKNKCTRNTKEGGQCGAMKTYNGSCWSHMSGEEKEKHAKIKAAAKSSPSSKKYNITTD